MTNRPENDQTEDGNTIHPRRIRNWCFTLNNPEKSDISSLISFADQKDQYLFQEETGEEGTPHLQGMFLLKNKIAFSTLKTKFPKIHWEPMRNKKASIEYCKKAETRTGEIFTNMKIKRKVDDPLDNLNLYPYQSEILKIISTKPDNRTIHWYWEENGNIGKTTIAKHICMNHNALYLSGKGNDIKYAVSEYLKKNDLNVVIFDFTRSIENYISYESIESVKNGIFFSGKYEGGMCIFNCPHVFIFANFEPNESKLSKDRWRITEIGSIETQPQKETQISSPDVN